MQLWSHTVGVATRRYGGMEVGCKRADMEVFASRAPELRRCCRLVDVEVFAYGAPELLRCDAGV